MVRRLMALVIGLVLLVPVLAADDAVQFSPDDSVRTVLAKHVGERLTVKLDSGEELTGKVQAVGDHAVHLAELSGKEFYDAIVDLDEVAAVIIRVRSK